MFTNSRRCVLNTLAGLELPRVRFVVDFLQLPGIVVPLVTQPFVYSGGFKHLLAAWADLTEFLFSSTFLDRNFKFNDLL